MKSCWLRPATCSARRCPRAWACSAAAETMREPGCLVSASLEMRPDGRRRCLRRSCCRRPWPRAASQSPSSGPVRLERRWCEVCVCLLRNDHCRSREVERMKKAAFVPRSPFEGRPLHACRHRLPSCRTWHDVGWASPGLQQAFFACGRFIWLWPPFWFLGKRKINNIACAAHTLHSQAPHAGAEERHVIHGFVSPSTVRDRRR